MSRIYFNLDKINLLFSSPVVEVYVEEDTEELKNIQDCVPSYNQQPNTSSTKSMRILKDYPKISNILLNKFKSVAEDQIGYVKKNYIITTSWITSVHKNEQSHFHSHRNSFWSGVYYFQDDYPDGTGCIQFENPIMQLWDVTFQDYDIENFNSINSLIWNIYPKPKKLLLFPSYLKHSVLTHNIDTERRSLAFNIMPTGNWGAGDSTYCMDWSKENI